MYKNFEFLNTKKLFLRMNGLNMKPFDMNVEKIKLALQKIKILVEKNNRIIDDAVISIRRRENLQDNEIRNRLIDLLGHPIMLMLEFINETELIEIISAIIKTNQNQDDDDIFGYLIDWCENSLNDKYFRYLHDEFMFKASTMVTLLDRVEKISGIISQQISSIIEISKKENVQDKKSPIVEIPDSGLHFNSIAVQELLVYIPSILNSISVLQDRFFPLIGLTMAIREVPDTITDTKRRIDNKTLETIFTNEIKSLFLDYMNNSGEEIRHYRNLDQHTFSLINNYSVDKDMRFHLYLPDDPTVKSFQNITFKQKIDALPLIRDSIEKFHRFIDNVLEKLGCVEIMHKNGCTGCSFSEKPTNGCIEIMQNGNKVICLFLKDGSLTDHVFPFALNSIQMVIK